MKKMKPYVKLIFLLVSILFSRTIAGQNYLYESFDGETFPPTGWTQAQVSGTGLWERFTTGNFPSCSPYSGAAMVGYRSVSYPANTSAVLISPSINLFSVSNSRLQFWMYRDDGITSKLDVVNYYINTSASLSDASLLGTINRPITADPIEASSGWYMYEFDIPETFNGTENYILLKATSKYGMNMFVDEVRVYRPEAANGIPTSFGVEGVTQTAMTVKWTDNSANETGFRVYISTDDVNYSQYGSDIISTTQAETGAEYTQAITNLLPGTTYYFRISAFYELESGYLTGNQATLEAGLIVSTGTGNWNSTSTWSSGTIPTISDNVLIETGHTVTLNATGYFNNLTVNGTLSMQSYTLSGTTIDVAVTGSINVIAGTNANLSVNGDITNNGTMNFYTSDVIVGRITFTGTNTQTFNANGTTNLGFVVVNKGSSYNNIAEIVANGTFGIKNSSTANFLTLTNGTLKISGTATVSNNVFSSIGYTISGSCGFWLNNPNFEVLGQNAPTTVNGLLRISSGIYNIGNTSNNSLSAGAGANITIEGGTLNLASRLYTSNAITFTLSVGTINVNLFGNTESSASFGLVSSNNTINIFGGTINLVKPSDATTPLDYEVNGSTLNITGGTLQVGTESTPSPYDFHVKGSTPNLIIDNTTNTKYVTLSGSTNIYGDLTVNSGSTLNSASYNLQLVGNATNTGNIINDGLITNSSSTGSNLLLFSSTHGLQTVSGTGTIGDATTPFAGITISNSSGVTLSSALVTNRINLLKGIVTGANNITLGNGAGSNPTVQRGGSILSVAGSFDQAPTVSSGSTYSVVYSSALVPITTGYELPTTLIGTLELATNQNITLGSSVAAGKLKLSSSNSGNLISTEVNLPTITGTLPTDLTIQTGNTGYIYGPLAITLPALLVTSSTYLFPNKKSENNFLELVNPTTTAGGQVVIRAEVFDEASGGSEGLYIQDGSLQNRYWKTEIISGAESFTNTSVRVTQTAPVLTTENGLAKSSSLTGAYDLVSSNQPIGNTLTSDIIDELGYFAIGVKQLSQIYQSSTITQTVTDIIMSGETDNLIIGIEIATTGNSPALQVTNLEFSTNGTSSTADIANAKLYFTGTSSSFSTGTQVGATVTSLGSTFSINPAQDLLEGTNYFWLVYDIAENAIDKNVVDAECTSITVSGTPYIPSVTAPAGSRIIRSYLSGTYLVGISGDYSTITEAITDLNLVGVAAPVYFILTDEEYTTSETFPITINDIINSSSNNFLVIKPATGVSPEITGTSNNPLFVVNASNFGIDGSNTIDGTTRDLTLTNNGTGASSGIVVANSGTENLSFKNIVGVGGATTAGYGIKIDGATYAEVKNCSISKVNIGIHSNNSNQIQLSNNELGSSTAESKIHTTGILAQSTSNFSIYDNKIIGVRSSTSATSSGIAVSGVSTTGYINNNEIRDIKNTHTTGYGSNGIWISSSSTTSNIKIYNNAISDIASYGFSGWDVGNNGYGIVLSSGGGYGIYFNTILLNTDQTSTNSRTAGLNISSAITTPNSLDVRNNIIINTQTIGTRYAVYCGASKTVFANINYNDYHSPTAIGFITFVRTTLADWQTGTGKDVNSLNLLPHFTSDTDLSLIYNMNCPLDGAGTTIAGITTDFLNITRDAAFPDMGAIEFTTVPFAAPAAEIEEVCYGSPSGLLTLSGYSGTIVRWEFSVSPFTDWSPIANLLDTYTSDPLQGNTRFRVILDYGLCDEFATEEVEVAVSPATVGGTVSGGSDICTGQTSGLLTLADHIGGVVRWESSVSPFDTWTTIDNTLSTYTSNALTETTRFRAVVKSGVCDELPSEYAEVVVFPESVGGTVSGGTTICSGETSSELSLSGNVGGVVRWEYSENGTDWFEIANTAITYTSEALSQTTHFRAVVQSGPCSETASEFTTVTVDPPSVGGAVTGGTSVCSGQTSGLLTLSGHTGIVVRWESSVSPFDIWSTIDNTLSTYTSGAITEVTRFKAVVQSGVCAEANSDYTEVTISPPTVGGSVTGGTSICEGETSGLLTLSSHTGDIIKWQSSTNLTDWTDIVNTTTTYTSGILLQTTHFRAVVKSGGCDALESEHTTVTVNSLPNATISSTDALNYCEGDAISVTFTATPTGTYKWFKDDVEITSQNAATYVATAAGSYNAEVTVNGCTDISNAQVVAVNPLPVAKIETTDALVYCEGDAISVTFTATPTGTYKWFKDDVEITSQTAATYVATAAGSYTAEVTVNGCSDISDAQVVAVNPLPVATISTTDELTYCEGDAISVTFTATPNGTYKWFKDDIEITSQTSATYVATAAGSYTAEVTVNGCSDISNAQVVAVNPLPVAEIETTDALVYCEGDAINVTFTASPAGTFKWFKDDVEIEGEAAATYVATAAGSYTAEVTVNGCSDISNAQVVAVNPLPVAEIETTDALVYCEGDAISVTFTATPTGTYKWFKGDIEITSQTAATYFATAAGSYTAEVTVNGCSDVSDASVIVVNQLPTATIATTDALTYCEGDEINSEFTVNIADATYQWLLYGEMIAGETSSTFTAIEAGVYSVEVNENGCSGISNELEVVVNPLPVTTMPTDTVFLPNFETYLFDAGEGFASYLWFDESTEQAYFFDGAVWGTGMYDVWVEVTNEFGCSTRDSVVVSVGHVGINTIETWSLILYPNPTSDNINLSIDGLSSRMLNITIFNATGQTIFKKDYTIFGGQFNQAINLSEKAKGFYIITINDGNNLITKRFVIE